MVQWATLQKLASMNTHFKKNGAPMDLCQRGSEKTNLLERKNNNTNTNINVNIKINDSILKKNLEPSNNPKSENINSAKKTVTKANSCPRSTAISGNKVGTQRQQARAQRRLYWWWSEHGPLTMRSRA